nr:PREDICTED: E3 ubiquitin-protein ligase AMFR-like [Bemisia tabaci]
MPSVFVSGLPRPSLKLYSIFSAALLSCSVFYAVQTANNNQGLKNNSSQGSMFSSLSNSSDTLVHQLKLSSSSGFLAWALNVITFILQDPLSIWAVINAAVCGLILTAKTVQVLVFGELRVVEMQHLKDKFWNYLFYKFIFVFGVINVQNMDEVILWYTWFVILGFLQLLALVCKDRFEYYLFSTTPTSWNHIRLLCLLGAILVLSGVLLIAAIGVGFFGGFNTFAFMAAECLLLALSVQHTLLRYLLHLYNSRGNNSWSRGHLPYYAELICDLTILILELLHHLHMLVWSNIFLSMASLVIGLHIKFLFYQIQRRIKKHRNYWWVITHMEKSYPEATIEELAENSDNCAICWEKMESARKLPCSHLFHNTCLQSWLEQDTSCPTCRMYLGIRPPPGMSSVVLSRDALNTPRRSRSPYHYFHFDGSRYGSWLPSFSVEVTHPPQLLRLDSMQSDSSSQIDSMARQVQQLFPDYPLSTLRDDLHVTRSVELTVENILDGRIPPPSPSFEEENGTPGEAPSSSSSWQPFSPSFTPTSSDVSIEPSEPLTTGSRFSKSPSERELILQLRKEKLLLAARKKYLDRQAATSPSGESSTSTDQSHSKVD